MCMCMYLYVWGEGWEGVTIYIGCEYKDYDTGHGTVTSCT